ncbi:MAG: asparagine--tRNA ligase [Candidatus Magasanikbacteria bacterium CG10_big_fil_rev_8_21_14_0_10_47_10]|uniref:Asparagine--tRNA ligase n=1 Tax=Candidatus Magasanikbacteria bacterium CG10_big_fil_rev_8_21_14_0_10_47_10 TaxID=1974652 RepID=A0A2H0TPF1_9BACT|nr:MAG: asparagine--tRNA ligase [Candidatus Magasanikbacteria bacterium CG10_big_fil_rev_8_21_14_0_10_47_10]
MHHISNIASEVGKEITIAGWLYNKRSSGKIVFLELRDGSGFMQAVVSEDVVDEATWKAVGDMTQESSLKVTGTVTAHPKKENVFELQVTHIEIVQIAQEYPITPKEHGPDFLLDHRHLWLRSKRQWAVQRIRDVIIRSVYDFYHEHGYVKVDTPILTPNACEGATELFDIEYFDEGILHLSQSGQLYLEAAIMSVGRGFDFGPVFRAEKSKTRKHLTEFWMMDAEAAFVEHDENMNMQEALVKYVVSRCLENCKVELDILERDTTKLHGLQDLPFERLEYSEAIPKLQALGSDIQFGDDLGADDEELLTKDSAVPVFIHKWPKSIKPFYMKVDPGNPELVLNNDLIGIENAGEIIGGSQREDDYETLKTAIESHGLEGPEYEWYLDLRRYGSVPHSGYGLGLERMVRWVSGVEHIRETIPFPRMINRVRP